MTKAVTSIRIAGFRSLKDVTLEPGRTTVLLGANGAGKSNVLSALRMVPLMRTHALRNYVAQQGGASALLHYGPQTTSAITLRLEFAQDTGKNAYEVRLGHAANDSLMFLDEQVQFQAPGTVGFKATSLGAGHVEARIRDAVPNNATAKTVNWWLSRMTFFHFHDTSMTSAMRQFARQEETRFLRSDGSNLAGYLLGLAQGQDEASQASWARINGLVRRVAPFIDHLEPTLVAPHLGPQSAVRLDWVDDRGYFFGAHHLSDGTLRAIALITALAQPVEKLPAFISIDEPELGLHPAALGLLAGLVQSVAPHCQVLLATQSPTLLDYFDVADVVVAERKDGATQLTRLDETKLAAWLEDYSLSEVWDKNLFGGRPCSG
jgi:predicted ATPase